MASQYILRICVRIVLNTLCAQQVKLLLFIFNTCKFLFFCFAELLFQFVKRRVHGSEEFHVFDCCQGVCAVLLFDRNAQVGLFPIGEVNQDVNASNGVEITTELLDLRLQMSLGLLADAAMSSGNSYVHVHLPFLLIAVCEKT